jgi:TRAP transporter TAXI family solute receptor
MVKALALTLSLALGLITALTAAAQWKPEVKFIKIGVSSAGGDWFRAGAKFSTMIPAALPEVAASTVIGGGVVNVTRIGKGETQMGFALTPYPEQGYKGESKHYPTALKNVRLIASNLGRTVVVAMVVLKDSPIKGLPDLKGKRIVPGDRGWGTTELVEALMAGAGMGPEKFKADGGTISYTSITDRSKALQDRNVDAIFIPAQVNFPDLMAVQQAVGIRVIGFPNDLVDKTLATMPGLVRSKVPKGLYGVVDHRGRRPVRRAGLPDHQALVGAHQGDPRDRPRPGPGRRADGHGARHHPLPPRRAAVLQGDRRSAIGRAR